MTMPLEEMAEGMGDATREHVKGVAERLVGEMTRLIDHRIATLRAELAAEKATADTTRALETRWAGIWSPGRGYSKDAICAHRHALWFALQPTTAEPGSPGGGGWQLCLRGQR